MLRRPDERDGTEDRPMFMDHYEPDSIFNVCIKIFVFDKEFRSLD